MLTTIPKECIQHFFQRFFGGLECVCDSFAYVAHFVFLRVAWIRTPEFCRSKIFIEH
jgi:hypothetical protein